MRILALLALVANGCILANLTPQARFSESAHTLAEAARWNHVDMAMPLLSTKYSAAYLARHRDWGGAVTIADTELVHMQVADDRQTATSELTVSWYLSNGITLRQSTISQKWESERGNFRLVDETVRQGDGSLFAAAEPVPAEAEAAQK